MYVSIHKYHLTIKKAKLVSNLRDATIATSQRKQKHVSFIADPTPFSVREMAEIEAEKFHTDNKALHRAV